MDFVACVRQLRDELKFDPNELRDERGRWTEGASLTPSNAPAWATAGKIALGVLLAAGLVAFGDQVLALNGARVAISGLLDFWQRRAGITAFSLADRAAFERFAGPAFELFRLSSLKSALTTAESSALRNYAVMTHIDINKFLRTGAAGSLSFVKEEISGLDGAFAKAALSQSITVYRGITKNAFESIKNSFRVGNVMHDASFVSTTLNANYSKYFGDHQIAISVPQGSKAIPMGALARWAHEGEVLLNRGTRFKVLSSDEKRTHLEALP